MKYDEYQVWYHTYNTAISSLLQSELRGNIDTCIQDASKAANYALDMYRVIEDKPQTPNIDLQGLVERVASNVGKKR
jgi:hypothetical protein